MVEDKETALWTFVAEKLEAGQRVACFIVAADEKGSPGKQGFKMALGADAASAGTIGGGVMEYRLKDEYARRLRGGETFRDCRLLVHSPQTKRGEPSGLSCAGSQTVCVLSLEQEDAAAVASIVRALRERLPAHIIASSAGLGYEEGRTTPAQWFVQASSERWQYRETLGHEFTVFIVGGGHVGGALSRIMATLSMDVVVYDEREGLPHDGTEAHACTKITDAYARLGAYITEPGRTFAAVVTSDYSTDLAAVKQLLPLGLAYLGVMGSDAKVARITGALSETERAAFEEQRVHVPIGLPIGSSTAEEIAVSIAAEIIAVKHRLMRPQ